jgi:hypothetical protein
MLVVLAVIFVLGFLRSCCICTGGGVLSMRQSTPGVYSLTVSTLKVDAGKP